MSAAVMNDSEQPADIDMVQRSQHRSPQHASTHTQQGGIDIDELVRQNKELQCEVEGLRCAHGAGAHALQQLVGVDGERALERAVEQAAAGDLAAVVEPLMEALGSIQQLQVWSDLVALTWPGSPDLYEQAKLAEMGGQPPEQLAAVSEPSLNPEECALLLEQLAQVSHNRVILTSIMSQSTSRLVTCWG